MSSESDQLKVATVARLTGRPHPSIPFRLSREERDHIAGHALDSIYLLAKALGYATQRIASDVTENHAEASDNARKIAVLSNLLGDIGWERKFPQGEWGTDSGHSEDRIWHLGELFPVAQLRPWLEEWQRQDNEAVAKAEVSLLEEKALEAGEEARFRKTISDAQTKLGTGAILLARIEKWMVSHEN